MALQRTAAPGSWTIRVISLQLLQPTGRFRRRSLRLNVGDFVREFPGTIVSKEHMKTLTRVRLMAGFLRFLAACEVLIFSITFMPDSWIALFHAWLGLGQMPDSVFLRYMIRAATLCQGAIGVALWIMASDVVRFRPLVIVTAVALLVASPGFYFIDTFSGMPLAVRIWDCAACFLAGAVLLALCIGPLKASPNQVIGANGGDKGLALTFTQL